MPDINREFKIWLPSEWTPRIDIQVDGTSVLSDCTSAEFTGGIIGVETICKITLVDSEGDYAREYTGGETIEFFCDMVDGTTSIWKGTLEHPKRKFGGAYTLELIGSDFQADLTDITVTEEYTNENCEDILRDIISKYLTGYTTTNVGDSTVETTIKWNNKPFFDCVLDLCEIAEYDAYVDTDKDFHFFERESITNDSESIVWNDTLMEIKNFGADQTDVRNRIIVYGEDESGLPIVYQADDTTSQTANGVKEKIIKDSSARTYEQCKSIGDGTLAAEKDKANKGEVSSLIVPTMRPGQMVWLTNPVQDITDTFRLIKYTHKYPEYATTLIFAKDKTIPTIFKERKKAELASENLTNPFKMKGSLNLTFDTEDDYDTTASSTVELSESNLIVTSGNSSGVMVSNRRTTTTDITAVHLKIKGDFLSGTTYSVSTNDGGDWETISSETLKTLSSTGKNLRLKINLTSADTRIDSVSLLYK